MRRFLVSVAVAAATALVPALALSTGTPAYAAPVQAAVRSADGTLTIASDRVLTGEPVELTFATDAPHPKNWVALYRDPGNGPVDQAYVGPSLVWQYVTTTSGAVSFDSTGLQPGAYVAYFLAQDGYGWLADPVDFTVVDEEELHFASERIPLRNAWQYADYRARIDGTLLGDTTGVTFRKVSGPDWIRVTRDGAVRGTPLAGLAGRESTAVVEATNAAGEKARTTVGVDVRWPKAELVPDARVMTWNMWFGGTRVDDSREKQVRFLLQQDVDIVAVQESYSTSAQELGEALGWDYYQAGYDLGILSRYPIIRRSPLPEESGIPAISATIRLDSRRGTDVTVWNAHLGYTPYGPYDACFGQLGVDQLMAKEAASGRTGEIVDILDAMKPALRRSGQVPVLLTGDFNAPSHLDWSARTNRCGYAAGVPWPTSVKPVEAGLTDTYRAVNRDPLASPGLTWSPVYETFTGGYGYDDHIGEPEPQDRIDFVYAKGDWRPTASQAVVAGTPAPIPDHADNEWTSDHAAVVTTFRVR